MEETLSQSKTLNQDAETTILVEGIDCENEVNLIENALWRVEGVMNVRTNIMKGEVTIIHDGTCDPKNILRTVSGAGFSANLNLDKGATTSSGGQKGRLLSVLVSGCATGVGLLLMWMGWLAPVGERASFGIAIVAGAWFIVPKAIAAARRRRPDMNLLMTVAVTGAIGIGEWSEGAAVTFLFALSELLESYSVARARRAIQSLLNLSPVTALVKRGDEIKEVAVEGVAVGETIIVKSGSRVSLDGEVIAGQSAVDQAPITGESMPVEKSEGDIVYAGTINGEGSLEAKVTKGFKDTTLARIIHLVEEAQSEKAPSERAIDVFAKYYTPSVMVFAVLLFLVPTALNPGGWMTWFYRALVLLVIACPCALVISTPVSIVSGLTAMARRGVLIKGGAHLETIGRVSALAVDKTGTITLGQPRVTQVVIVEAKCEDEVLRIAAAIDIHSEHPLAQAIVRHADEKGIDYVRGENFQSNTGRGAEAEIDGHYYFVSNHRYAHNLGLCSEELEGKLAAIEREAQSVIIVGHRPHEVCRGEILGIIGVGDTVRAEANRAIELLHKVGVKRVVMLSGDNQRTANAIAKIAGIDEAYGDLLPEQKVAKVKELISNHRHVGMVGDGVNDAPAMAAASVSIAMGAVGTDTAIETADIALMQDNLLEIGKAIRLGRRTVRIIQANIAFALSVKAIFLALAVMGTTSLWLAILADTGATLIVIANALRLLKTTEE